MANVAMAPRQMSRMGNPLVPDRSWLMFYFEARRIAKVARIPYGRPWRAPGAPASELTALRGALYARLGTYLL
jgi:hypothetical protein